MPSAAAIARTEGLGVLTAFSGETLTFRGRPLVAVVNRDVEQLNAEGVVDFTDQQASVIEIRRSELATKPLNTELITDEDGRKHRIRLVKTRDLSWICICEVES